MWQAYPLVTTVVDLLVFKEFAGCRRVTGALLAAMFTFYLAAVALLAASARLRPPQA